MRDIRQKRAERLGLVMDEKMRATIEAEAIRRKPLRSPQPASAGSYGF